MQSQIRHTQFIRSPFYDYCFFILSPLLALFLGWAGSRISFLSKEQYWLWGHRESWMSLFSGTFTMAHLFIVFFRSHANPFIFKQYPWRFTVAPLGLFAAMALSSWMLIFVFVLAVWWDVYHSSLQTFGLGRIYDLKNGHLVGENRRLDRGMSLLIYAGPILAGISLIDHLKDFALFEKVGTPALAKVPEIVFKYKPSWSAIFYGMAAAWTVFYFWMYVRLCRRGYAVSLEKALLFASTGICSIYAWGFNSFGQAFFIMNFFHALQYFALIWHYEKNSILSLFRLDSKQSRGGAGLVLFLVIGFSYGLWAKLLGESSHLAMSVLLTVSIMHFWYDGFIWSVQKKQIG